MCGCGGELKEGWHLCCPGCWATIPDDFRKAYLDAHETEKTFAQLITQALLPRWTAKADARRLLRKTTEAMLNQAHLGLIGEQE